LNVRSSFDSDKLMRCHISVSSTQVWNARLAATLAQCQHNSSYTCNAASRIQTRWNSNYERKSKDKISFIRCDILLRLTQMPGPKHVHAHSNTKIARGTCPAS
jgi:hypothetical protein